MIIKVGVFIVNEIENLFNLVIWMFLLLIDIFVIFMFLFLFLIVIFVVFGCGELLFFRIF